VNGGKVTFEMTSTLKAGTHLSHLKGRSKEADRGVPELYEYNNNKKSIKFYYKIL